MIRIFHANEYIQPADRGINRPLILRGTATDGQSATLFVKTNAGYGTRPAAPGVELFTTLLARELTLTAPEPVLLTIPPGFERLVLNAPDHQQLVRQSCGLNFATVALGPDWKTWPVEMSTRSFPQPLLGDILAFDALVQHTDRHPDNPNMMWRQRDIAVLDHEKCFGHLVLWPESQHPWRDFLATNPLSTHSLRRSVSPDALDLGQRLWLELIGLEMNNRLPQLAAAAQTHFPAAKLELDRILHYFGLLNRNMPDFFDYFRASMSL